MLSGLLTVLGTIFGFKQGASVGNAVAGVMNWGALGAGALYVLNHSQQQIPLGSVSLGSLGLAGAGLFVLFEFARRSSPGAGGA